MCSDNDDFQETVKGPYFIRLRFNVRFNVSSKVECCMINF